MDMTEDADAQEWLAANVMDWARRDVWMPPALFEEPYVLAFEDDDLEHYIVTRGWECEAGLVRATWLKMISANLKAEGRPPNWSATSRRAGNMNLRGKVGQRWCQGREIEEECD